MKTADTAVSTAEKKLALAIKARDVQVGDLKRDVEAMMRARELVVKMEDGKDAIVLATQAYVEQAATMRPESRYVVRGKARFFPGGDEPARITMREAQVVQ